MDMSPKAARLGEVISVLARYGFANRVTDDTPEQIRRWFTQPDGELLSGYTEVERLRMALTELGTTFIKLGQMLSSREDLVGPVVAEELRKLQADTPADPPDVVRTTLESELGKSLDELYADIDLEPMGSASIGQVHAATLHDGTEVVVKVLHQGVDETVHADVELMATLAAQLEKFGKDLPFQPRSLVAEFRQQILREIDLKTEARSLERFIHNFQDDPTVVFPEPYPELSTSHVLTMTKLVGINLNNQARLAEEQIDLKEIATVGANIWIEMIFRDSFFHADPHPGNLLVLSAGRVGVLDCGMVGYLDNQTREDMDDLVLAFAIKDVDQIVDTVLRICDTPRGFQRRPFAKDVSVFMADYLDRSVKDMDLAAMMEAINDIIHRHRLTVPANVIMLSKAMSMLEGTSHLADPDFDLNEALKPHYQAILERRYSAKRLLSTVLRSLKDWERLFTALPGEVGDILAMLQQGEFGIRFEVVRLDRVTNRLIYGLVVAALILASAMVWSAEVGPMVEGFSVLGVIGVLLAIGLVIRLFGRSSARGACRPAIVHKGLAVRATRVASKDCQPY